MTNSKFTNLTTIETIIITGGTKYICLCGQYKVHFCSPEDIFKIVSYAAEIVKKEVNSIEECSKYCSKYNYIDSYCLEINNNYKYHNDDSDILTVRRGDY